MAFDPDTYAWELDLDAYQRTLARSTTSQTWFRPTYEGFENLRGSRGIMLVANHGLLGFELMPLLVGGWEVAGRPIRAVADHVLFATAVQRRFMEARGAVEGTPKVADRLLRRGEILYVCPGGAREALSEPKDRYKLFWDQSRGFVRSSIRAGAPIAPMAILGHDETFRQLRTAPEMKRTPLGKLVVKAFGAKYVPPLYVGLGPFPLPQQFHFLVGELIEVPADPSLADDPATVDALHEQSRVAVEALIARAKERRQRRLASMPDGPEKWLEKALIRAAGDGTGT
ncbi:MAG: lysophospholipid acyltransferase family protein [Polyangiales bacterium]